MWADGFIQWIVNGDWILSTKVSRETPDLDVEFIPKMCGRTFVSTAALLIGQGILAAQSFIQDYHNFH